MKTNVLWSRLHFVVRCLGLTGLVVAAFGGLVYMAEPDFAKQLLLAGGGAALVALVVEIVVAIKFVAGRRSAFGLNVVVQIVLAVLVLAVVNVLAFFTSTRFDLSRDSRFTLPPELQARLADLRGTTRIVVLQQHKAFADPTAKSDVFDFAAERKVVEKVRDAVDLFREAGPQFEVFVLDVAAKKYTDELDRATEGAEALKAAIKAAPENAIFFWTAASKDRVRQLTFNEFYTLDKKASEEANGGQGNLVLLDRGVEALARKVLNLDDRKPRIAIAVNHEWLTTEGPDLYGLRGLRKALERHGYEVRDVVLQRLVPNEFAPGRFRVEPSAYTYQESRFNSLESRVKGLDEILTRVRAVLEENARLGKAVASGDESSLAELMARRDPRSRLGRNVLEQLTQAWSRELARMPAKKKEEYRAAVLEDIREQTDSLTDQLDQFQKARDKRVAERDALNVESFAEQRRMTDLKAKLTYVLDDCDLVLVPRMTIMSLVPEMAVPPDIHNWDARQVEALRDWVKKGKPVLACFGPPSVSADEDQPPPPPPTPDGLETMLASLGVVFGGETILSDIEAEALSAAGGQSRVEVRDMPDKVPPVEFGKETNANPISKALRLASRSAGRPLDLEIRYPRSLQFEAPRGHTRGGGTAPETTRAEAKGAGDKGGGDAAGIVKEKGPDALAEKGVGWTPEEVRTILRAGVFAVADSSQLSFGSLAPLTGLPADSRATAKDGGKASGEVSPEFLLTALETWREESPFPSAGKMMLPTPAKRGPFPVGVAVEVEVPEGWYGDQYPLPATRSTRIAAIGHGGFFIGGELSPAKEKLILDTTRWLLDGDGADVDGKPPWSYPRLAMTSVTASLWSRLLWVGPPLVFVWLGVVVLMFRRLR